MTYSIIAVDAESGDIGLAAQSHWFAIGDYVPFVQAGIGAIARQAQSNVLHGERGIKLLAHGLSPQQVLAAVLEGDPGRDIGQTAIIDTNGDAVCFTGDRCLPESQHRTGKYYSVQANTMLRSTVCSAMEHAWQSSTGPLAERMLDALDAAEREGGDIRGAQSATLIVSPGRLTETTTEKRLVDLNIYDHRQPLVELRRLLNMQRAYEHVNRAELAFFAGEADAAAIDYARALELLPEQTEISFWYAIALANMGNTAEAMILLHQAWSDGAQWKELTSRMLEAQLVTGSVQAIADALHGNA